MPTTSGSQPNNEDDAKRALTAADSHDRIRVHGARVNNLKDISIEIPKRRLTAFTGVSGSGKSSLVFGTIAAESQRLINETYSAFLQGFMPSLANARSTVGTVTDANAMMRILFSRLGTPHIGSPQAFSFNVATVRGAGAITVERGAGKSQTEKRTFTVTGGMCPRCEGMGAINDIDLTQLVDESKSINDGAILAPGFSADGWYGRIFGAIVPADLPIAKFTAKQRTEFLYGEDNINVTFEGLVPKIQKSILSKDVDALQPHVRAFVQRAVTFTTCPDCGGSRLNEGARSAKIAGLNIADACAMQISDLADWVRGLDEPSVAPLLAALRALLDSFVDITSAPHSPTSPTSLTSPRSDCTRTTYNV